MDLSISFEVARNYKSQSQKIRVISESWVKNQIYCPSCGLKIKEYSNNKPVADFFCFSCKEDYELKSKHGSIPLKIVDGAYKTMLERLESENNPNLFLLNYSLKTTSVVDFLVVPKHFFVPQIIQKRTALSVSARRYGWVGCNILLDGVPEAGRIFLVKDGIIQPKDEVVQNWRKTLFLREESIKMRGWILDILNCIEQVGKTNFTLSEMYDFEPLLKQLHPANFHIKDKIRQQLQVLRDKGYLEFAGKGEYRLL